MGPMHPVFALVVALLWLPLPLFQERRLASESLPPEGRVALERSVTGPGALLVPAGAALLLLSGSWFAFRADSDHWWMWLLAGVLFAVNVLLGLRLRRTVTGQWLGGGPRQSGKRALATRLGISGGVLYVGTYVTTWATGPEEPTWVTVLTGVLLGASLVLMVTAGLLLMLAMQDEANEEWERDRRA